MMRRLLPVFVVLIAIVATTIPASAQSGAEAQSAAAQPPAPTVYSLASITGNYGFAFSQMIADTVSYYGFISMDGKGHITGGSLYIVPTPGNVLCKAQLSGSYSMASNGFGSMKLKAVPVATLNCTALDASSYFPTSSIFELVASQSGVMMQAVGLEAPRVDGGPASNSYQFVLGRQ